MPSEVQESDSPTIPSPPEHHHFQFPQSSIINNPPSHNTPPRLNSPPRFKSPRSRASRTPINSPKTQNENDNALLSAMREQMSFMADQQRLFQEERISNRNALREQHEFMAEQQRQLMVMLVNNPHNNIPTHSSDHNNSRNGPKARMADPPSFDGSIKESENFLSSLENIFDSQPSSFPSPESRIRYALTFFTGGASNHLWLALLLTIHRQRSTGHCAQYR